MDEKREKVRKRITPILRHLERKHASLAEHAPQPEHVHVQVQVQVPHPTQVQVQVQVPPSPPLQPRVVEVSRKSSRFRKRPVLYAPNPPPPAAAVRRVDLDVEVFESKIHGKGVRLSVDAKDGTHVMFMEGAFKGAQCKKLLYRNGESRKDFDSAAYINKRLVQFS